jgi:hypothetical protein
MTDFNRVHGIVENGTTGVRQMSRQQFVEEWDIQFDARLEITELESIQNRSVPARLARRADVIGVED